MSGSWKVAYSDFMTAMMAFFLLMWILNMAPPGEDANKGKAPGGVEIAVEKDANGAPIGGGTNAGGDTIYVDKIDTREFNAQQVERSHYAIMLSLKGEFTKDALPQAAGGLRYNDNGVFINLTSDLMFIPGTTKFSQDGEKVLDAVADIMKNYDVYLVVRGYTDSSEKGGPNFPSKWELSAAKANAAIEALITKGADPTRMRAVAYADTNPLVPSTVPGAAAKNSRVEFNFHRPEVMSTLQNF